MPRNVLHLVPVLAATMTTTMMAAADAARCQAFVAHPGFIGPKDEQQKHDKYYCRSSATTCMEEASKACAAATNCSSFGISPGYGGGKTPEFYSTHWNESIRDGSWTLYSCATDAKPPAAGHHGGKPGGKPGGGGTQTGHGHSSRPANAPNETDCAVRKLAAEYGRQLIPMALPELQSGLELGAMCGEATLPSRSSGPSPFAAGTHTPTGTDIVVDSQRGSDQQGDGSAAAPFRSLAVALQASRQLPRPPTSLKAGDCAKTITLKGGVHYLNSTMELMGADSGLCLVGAAGEHAILSGGMELSLSWKPSDSGTHGEFVADLPAATPHFDQLFVSGQREIRAKYPNGDPEVTGLYTADTGYISAGSWKSTPPEAPSKSVTVNLQSAASKRIAPKFPDFKMSFGGLCHRYANNRSFWGGTPRPTAVQCTADSRTGENYSQPCKKFNWKQPATGVAHAFHGGHWGGWMFQVTGLGADQTIGLDPWGGQQEARGNTKGAEWYVENIREEVRGAHHHAHLCAQRR
jgi:hypothetical protein